MKTLPSFVPVFVEYSVRPSTPARVRRQKNITAAVSQTSAQTLWHITKHPTGSAHPAFLSSGAAVILCVRIGSSRGEPRTRRLFSSRNVLRQFLPLSSYIFLLFHFMTTYYLVIKMFPLKSIQQLWILFSIYKQYVNYQFKCTHVYACLFLIKRWPYDGWKQDTLGPLLSYMVGLCAGTFSSENTASAVCSIVYFFPILCKLLLHLPPQHLQRRQTSFLFLPNLIYFMILKVISSYHR